MTKYLTDTLADLNAVMGDPVDRIKPVEIYLAAQVDGEMEKLRAELIEALKWKADTIANHMGEQYVRSLRKRITELQLQNAKKR